MDPPPPYKESASVSRSRVARASVSASADALLRSSLSRHAEAPTSPGSATSPGSPPPLSSPSLAASARSHPASPRVPASPGASASAVAPASPRRPSVASRSSEEPASPGTPTSESSASRRALSVVSGGFTAGKAPKSDSERLRQVERERDELRRMIAGERALTERLKSEGDRLAYVSTKEAKRRASALKDEALAAVAASQATRKPAQGLFKEACSTDLLFLLDSTSSMRRQIENVKQQVKDIVLDISKAFFNEAEVRIAVAAYRDHADRPNIQVCDFTKSTNVVFTFLDRLTASGGGDPPEDVLGGIKAALNASWAQGTRCIVHIADAPPHGRIFQEEPRTKDDYPEPGSEPHGLTYLPLIRQMVGLNINYMFLPIANFTDRMAYLFSQVYGEEGAEVTLNKGNKYFYAKDTVEGQSNQRSNGWASSKRSAQGRLLFVEGEYGSINKHLRSLVVKSVLSSAPRTATRASESGGRTRAIDRTIEQTLAAITEDGDDEATLEEGPPRWTEDGWLDEKIHMEGFSPDVVVHGPNTLNVMMTSDDKIKISSTELTVRKRSLPFAQGAMRTAAYAKTTCSSHPYVVKAFKREGRQLAHLAEDMRCQALCKAFALEFNALAGKTHSVDFIVTTCLRGKATANSETAEERLSLEPFIAGEYVKYNNNCGFVNESLPKDHATNVAAQAFSHFTFERSQGKFLVCDLQGAGNVLTDPAIHALDPARFPLSDTNLGEDGFKFFFATHECNAVCRNLGLKSTAAMLLAGKIEFKEKWGNVGSTVCCSNKLCGRIVRLESASTSLMYPGFYWCEGCFPQLDTTRTRWVCVGPGPYHTFVVSSFFFESQGRLVPRTCPTHRVRDESVPKPPSVGGNFWDKLKFKGKNKTG